VWDTAHWTSRPVRDIIGLTMAKIHSPSDSTQKMDPRDRRIAELEAQLHEREAAIAEMEEQLQGQNKAIAALEEQLQGQNKAMVTLQKQVRQLEEQIGGVKRAGKRQATPFARRKSKDNPKRPGRKKGQGKFSHRPKPAPEEVTETKRDR